MRLKEIFAVLLISAFFTASPLFAATAPLQVQDVRYGGAGNKTRIVLDLSRASAFRAFLLDDPQRIVLDLPGATFATFKSRVGSNSTLVKSYRSGTLDDGLTRVIFDLKKTAVIDNAFAIPKSQSGHQDRIVIDLSAASANAFSAATARVFGDRQLKAATDTARNQTPAADSYAQKQNDDIRATTRPQKSRKTQAATPAKKIYTIVVDAGHGGDDPGAEAPGFKEKNITLAIARELRRQLEESGRYKVVMTRDKDFYITLHERRDLSRAVHADLFISIHADKSEHSDTRGSSIYSLSEKASDAETARLAEDENNAGFVAGVDLGQESQDVADILLDLAMRDKMNESNLLATMLVHSFQRNSVRLLPNSHRSAGFAVLKAPDVPSVLIETGFISNQNEAKLLSSGAFQRNISGAIVDGVDTYFHKIQALQKP